MVPPPVARDFAGGADATRADRLGAAEFAGIAELIGREIGLQLSPAKREMVEGRLRKRVRALGVSDLAGYCRDLLRGEGLEDELTELIDVLTTNKTDFFREPEHFRLLESRLVPDLLTAARRPRQLKIWSAACSTGAEAYTAAMVLADMQARGGRFEFAILGTDISTRVLEIARRAVYPEAFLGPVPERLRARWLMKGRAPASSGTMRVSQELRRRTRFGRMNLMDRSYPIDADVDVIFLRNVLIYFSREDQGAVISRMVDHLRPGGFLLLGHAEAMVGAGDAVEPVAPAVYRKL